MKEEDLIEIQNLLNSARNSISNYCINECKALCCKKGKLVLFNDKEIDFICQSKKNKLLKRKVLVKKETSQTILVSEGLEIVSKKNSLNSHHYNLERVSCSHLTKDNLCDGWKDINRPKICSDFPLFLTQNKFVITGGFCPAVKNGLLDNYLKKLENKGLKII